MFKFAFRCFKVFVVSSFFCCVVVNFKVAKEKECTFLLHVFLQPLFYLLLLSVLRSISLSLLLFFLLCAYRWRERMRRRLSLLFFITGLGTKIGNAEKREKQRGPFMRFWQLPNALPKTCSTRSGKFDTRN